MSSNEPSYRSPEDSPPSADLPPAVISSRRNGRRWLRIAGLVIAVLVVIAIVGLFVGRYQVGKAMRQNLPQLDGSIPVPGLSANVTVQRDAHGVPHIQASSMDDLVFAQGFVTAQDRLWQMDLMRRNASGELAAILGRVALTHDRLQRTLQLRTAADNAYAALPTDQRHWLQVYAAGVNASLSVQQDHLPVEFRLLGYHPAPWNPRDSMLIELAMFQELTTGFPAKLGREALAAHLPPYLIADLYPTGSWRDHPPGQLIPDVTAPQPEIKDVPLDESQSRLRQPDRRPPTSTPVADLMALQQTLSLFRTPCADCVAGSNEWAVSGSRTASGKPMLSNDMHLPLAAPGTWYEADLRAAGPGLSTEFHVAGVTLPGAPFVIVGHNQHVSWGFTNLGADVQDIYIEHTRGTPNGAEYQTAGGEWRAVQYRAEIIHIRGGSDEVLNVPLTQHGGANTPVISSIFPGENRTLSLRWTIYDPGNVTVPFFMVNSATDWTSMQSALEAWGGPAQNLVYADGQGHIGYHAVGRIPIRGDVNNPSMLSAIPTDATSPDAGSHEWVGYIPFDQLPQAFDPADGVLATANARVTPDGYRFPITLDWEAPYRNERIYKVLEQKHQLAPADMLALENDDYSELDQVIAQRLAYAIDHATGPLKDDKTLRQAADLLRKWNGKVDAEAVAPSIVNAARSVFWLMLLVPRLAPPVAEQLAQGADLNKIKLTPEVTQTANLWEAYAWGERGYVEERLLTDTPVRWLPQGYGNWNDFLAAVVARGLRVAHAPKDLNEWKWGQAFPLDVEHPIFSRSKLLQFLIAAPTGTGLQPHSGDGSTIRQLQRAFGSSERFTADMSDPDHAMLNLVLGQSGNPASPWYLDQFQSWLNGTTYSLPFSPAATQASTTHTLILTPR